MIAYGRIFRSKKTIVKESQTRYEENVYEERHRLIETRVAQIGAALLAIGFALQIWGNLINMGQPDRVNSIVIALVYFNIILLVIFL